MQLGPTIEVSAPKRFRPINHFIDEMHHYKVDDRFHFLNGKHPIYGIDKNLQEGCLTIRKLGLLKLYKMEVMLLSACIRFNHLDRALVFVDFHSPGSGELSPEYFKNQFIMYDIKHVWCLGATSDSS